MVYSRQAGCRRSLSCSPDIVPPPPASCPPAAASGVSWKGGKDVTVKVMKKKPKPGGWVGGWPGGWLDGWVGGWAGGRAGGRTGGWTGGNG